jgi:hypothetical protein
MPRANSHTESSIVYTPKSELSLSGRYYLLGKIVRWKRGKSTQKNTRNDEFSAKLFDAIYENNLELAKTLIDGRM